MSESSNSTQSLFILGRQPALGLAELESRFGSAAVHPAGDQAAVVNVNPSEVSFNQLGGSIKLAKLLIELPTTDWEDLTHYINKTIPKHLDFLPEGKLKFGLSAYGLKVDVATINRSTLWLKKAIKKAGRSVRIVPNSELALGSAQVIHNQMTSPLGMELILVRDGDKTLLAQTVAEQNIEAYAARDQGRPKRDAKVGMLPPKLAQIIINLSAPTKDSSILDPFCGTGVILQEAVLMGLNAYGTDLEQRMVDYTQENVVEWLPKEFAVDLKTVVTAKGDATALQWKTDLNYDFDRIACETYLGRPFSALPAPDVLQDVMQDVNLIHKRFLQNVARQTQPGMRLCIAVPAWSTPNGFKHLKVLDNLEDMGYNRIEFVHANKEDLVYHREGQIVGRELVILIRK